MKPTITVVSLGPGDHRQLTLHSLEKLIKNGTVKQVGNVDGAEVCIVDTGYNVKVAV